jgi:hypothetical protein
LRTYKPWKRKMRLPQLCYNKRNPKKGIEMLSEACLEHSARIFPPCVTTKEIPKRELR